MYGQGHYPPLFRPPYQQSQTNPPPLPPFQQAHPGPPPPPNPVNQPHSGPPPQYQHGVPPPQQPVPSYFCASSQPYMPMMSPMQGNHPMHTTYSQPNISYHPHHFSQPMPPPSIILPPPPPPPHSQGQVLYRTPAPPPPGIQHVPAPPPPPPSGFASVTPAPFTLYGQSTTGDAYPPSLPPPPPPPPPPSSPPPLPLSPPPPSSPAVEFHGILKAQSPDQPHCGNANAVVTLNDDEAGESENKDHVLKAEFLEDIPLPPPKPADEDVVRNIEAMCRFMVNVGPDFENLARTKEAGNPKFAFLFGGEPGNDAAIGHEYFQWMKMKFLSETHSPKDQEQIVTGPRALKVGDSSQSGKNDEGAAVSPSVSDMDMEDDVSHPDADIVADDLGKESASEAISLDRKIHAVTETFPAPMDDVSQPDADTVADDSDKASAGEAISLDGKIHVVHETFPAPMGTRDQLVPEVLESGTLSNTGSVQYQDDGVDGKVSPLLEDVSPVRHMPTAAKETKDNVQGFVRVPVEGSSQVNVSSAPAGGRILETPMVYVKDESPFRLIQGYASDNSEEDGERENDNEINAELTPTAAIGSDSPKDKTSKLPSSSTPDNVSPLEIGSNHQADSTQIFHSMPAKGGESLGNLPDKATSESVICPPVDPSNEVVDLQDDKLDDKIINCEPSQKNDLLDGGNVDTDHLIGNHKLEQDANRVSAKLDVDEFGRLVRKGASDSDSDDAHHSERHVKRGRNRSRSRSPQESRWRRRSRSPRRGERSRTRSRSPKRTRSRSPAISRRMNVNSRRDRDQPPECFNFKRGRCFRGASCRFLHRDITRHIGMQNDVSLDSGNHVRQDPAPSFELDKTAATEMDIEEHIAVPQEGTKGIDMECLWEQAGGSTRSGDAGNQGEKDVSASAADNTLLTVNSDIREIQVTNQEVINHEEKSHVDETMEKSQVDETVELSKPTVIEEPLINPPLFLQADSSLVQSTSPGSNQPCQINHTDNVSQPESVDPSSQEGSLSHNRLRQHTGQAMVNQSSPLKDFPQPRFSGTSSNFQQSQQVPPAPPGPPPLPPSMTNNLNAPLPFQHPAGILHPPATCYQSHPPPHPTFPLQRPPMTSDYHSHSTPAPNPGWYSFPPPPPTSHAMHPRHDFNPVLRPDPPREMIRLYGHDFHPQNFHSAEPSHRSSFLMDELRRPLPMGAHTDPPFVRGDRFSHPAMPNGPQTMSDSHWDHHLQNQSSHEDMIHLSDQGFASSRSFVPGNTMQPQSASLPRESLSNRSHSFIGEHTERRPFSKEEFSSHAIKDLPYSHHPPPYGHQQAGNINYPSNMNTTGFVDISLQRYPSGFLDNRLTHLNPFASTFEQALTNTQYVSNASGQENATNYNSSEYASVGRPESRLTSSPPDSKRSGEQILQDINSQVGAVSDAQMLVRNPAAGDAYDPIFDSIEPSSNVAKKLDHIGDPNSALSDGGLMSKSINLHTYVGIEENIKQKGSAGEHKLEVDEFGEVATDAEVGVVENASPQLDKDWSPDLPVDGGNPTAGEIEIEQVRSPGKSRRSKDSRSMKLFKSALADFVKEVLKPSWRQGNMSKEAFKTIVKKTVDKVSGAMPSQQIPKSQAKINQYVDSSQRKLTKLVMGYVDKYVKM